MFSTLTMLVAISSIFVSTLVIPVTGDCDEVAINTEYSDCRNKYKEDSGLTHCAIISNIIGDCSVLLESCRSAVEIKDINADLIKANIAQNISLHGCDIVEDYRSDGLVGPEHQPPNCTAEQEIQLKSDFENCTYAHTTRLETDKDNIQTQTVDKVMCDTLQNVSDACRGMLDQCFKTEKQEEEFNAQMEIIFTYIKVWLPSSTVSYVACNVTTPQDDIDLVMNNIKNVFEYTKKIVGSLSESRDTVLQHLDNGADGAGTHITQNTSLIMVLLTILHLSTKYYRLL